MAHTDKDLPWRLWETNGLTYDKPVRKYRANPRESKTGWIARRFNRRDRHDARADLRRGRTPEPRQPRHRAHYEAW